MLRHFQANVLVFVGGALGLIAAPGVARSALPMRAPAAAPAPTMMSPMMRSPMMGPIAGRAMNPGPFGMFGSVPPSQMGLLGNPSMSLGTAYPGRLANPYTNLGTGYPGTSMNTGYGGYGGPGMSGAGSAGGYGMTSNPYAASGGYGSSGGTGGGYGMGSNPYSSGGGPRSSSSRAAGAGVGLGTVLWAYGVPNDGGRVSWPLAFRVMGPEESQQMRQPLEALLGVAATAAVQGGALPQSLQRAGDRAVDRLRRWLREQQVGMAEGTYRDANAFLRQAEQALKAMNSY